MGLEIERRFIVKGNQWKKLIKAQNEFKQAYFTTNVDEWAIRLRITNNKESEITLKKKAGTISNHEFE